MSGIISALIILCSVLLVLIVLVQNSKGGGLSSTFAASNQVMGVRKTADFLEKATWTLAGILVVLCLAASAVNRKPSQQRNAVEATEEAP
jgi:preprotein translocase subunit SecG